MSKDIQIRWNPQEMAAFKRALRRNPRKVRSETLKLLSRGLSAFTKQIIRNPWRIGQAGGGAPVDTGNLRDTHFKTIDPSMRGTFEAFILPMAPYAEAVHEGVDSGGRTMESRPWLEYAREKSEPEIEKLGERLLRNITNDLAK